MKRSILCCGLGGFVLLAVMACGIISCGKSPAPTNTITVWHWMNDRDEAFQELARRYKAETGITVNFELSAASVYSQKVIAAAQARVLPDVYGVLGEKAVVASFIESGYVANLTPAFAANDGSWEKVLFPRALNVNRFETGNVHNIPPGIYGVPIDVTNIQMLYNKKLLAQVGVSEPPQTFDEFLTVVAKLKQAGIPGLVSGWGELWMIQCLASNYAFNIMGEDKVMATYRGEVSYTDPDWIKVLRVFERLRDSGALIDGIVTKQNKYAEQDFALERAAFAFNGSWCVNVYHDMNPNLEYGVMMPPAVNPDLPMRIWGGAGSSFVVNDASAAKEQAIAFLRWLTATAQQAYLAEATNNLPANREALNEIPPVLSGFAQAQDATTHPTVWPVNEDSLVNEAFTKGIQSLLIGELTPEALAAKLQDVKVRETEKKQRR